MLRWWLLHICFSAVSMNFRTICFLQDINWILPSRHIQLIDYDNHTLDATTIKLATTEKKGTVVANSNSLIVETNNSNHNWVIDFIYTHFNCLFYYFYGFVEVNTITFSVISIKFNYKFDGVVISILLNGVCRMA